MPKALKIIFWLAVSIAVAAIIMEGTYVVLGNGIPGRLLCTVLLIAVAPMLIKQFIRLSRDTEKHDSEDVASDKPE